VEKPDAIGTNEDILDDGFEISVRGTISLEDVYARCNIAC